MTNNSSFPAAILFDHDGTLVDTEPVWAAAKVALAAAFGGTWTQQDTLGCLDRERVVWGCTEPRGS